MNTTNYLKYKAIAMLEKAICKESWSRQCGKVTFTVRKHYSVKKKLMTLYLSTITMDL